MKKKSSSRVGSVCPVCGQPVEEGKFCSDDCKKDYRNFLYNLKFVGSLTKGDKR